MTGTKNSKTAVTVTCPCLMMNFWVHKWRQITELWNAAYSAGQSSY